MRVRKQRQIINPISNLVIFGKLDCGQASQLSHVQIDPWITKEHSNHIDSTIFASKHEWRETLVVHCIWIRITVMENLASDQRIINNVQESVAFVVHVVFQSQW